MSAPRLLDLFCKAGGAARGYQMAGFDVTGVDIEPQPRYVGDELVQGDALEFLAAHGAKFDAVHASPPCQAFCAYGRRPNHVRERPNLIPAVRAALVALGRPWVIENVPGAPLQQPILLCGSSFGLDVRRHRLFESSVPLVARPCDHDWQRPRFPSATNRPNLRRTVEVGSWRIPLAVQREAMEIDWMTREELSEAIPPAYAEHVGRQLIDALERRAAS